MVKSDALGITLNIYMFLFTIIWSSLDSLIGDMVLQLKYGTRAAADEHYERVIQLFFTL